jgi:hypothetical protein
MSVPFNHYDVSPYHTYSNSYEEGYFAGYKAGRNFGEKVLLEELTKKGMKYIRDNFSDENVHPFTD